MEAHPRHGVGMSIGSRVDLPDWKERYDDCAAFKKRIDAANGNVRLTSTAETGIRGNTHMMMMDRNNLQIADLVLAWIKEQASP